MELHRIRELLRTGVSIRQIPLRVTYYARVSTEKEEQASSLQNQISYYTTLVQSCPLWSLVQGYVDEGISGASTKKRDSFNRMIRDGKAGCFDLILTKEISRFSRNTVDSIQYTQELLRHGIGVVFENDGINTFDTDAELRLTIMSSLAQDEIRRLSERVKFGHRQCIKKGKVLGNDRLYGYNKKNCVLTIHEEQAAVVRQIFDLYANHGLGLRKISQVLYEQGITSSRGNQFNTRTMTNMLNNPKYKGYYCGNKTTCIDYRTKETLFLPESEWVVYKDENVPAIVPEGLWNKAHAILQERSQGLRQSGAIFHNRYAYSGKIVCGEHKTSYQRQLREGGKEVWQCRIYREKGAAACTAPILHGAELDQVMADIFEKVGKNRQQMIDQLLSMLSQQESRTDYRGEIEAYSTEIGALEKKKEKLLELSVEEAISNQEFKKRNDGLNRKIAGLERQLAGKRLERQNAENSVGHLDQIRQVLERELSFQEGINSELVASILDKIVVKNTGDKKQVSMDVYLTVGEIIPVSYEKKRTSVRGNNP